MLAVGLGFYGVVVEGFFGVPYCLVHGLAHCYDAGQVGKGYAVRLGCYPIWRRVSIPGERRLTGA